MAFVGQETSFFTRHSLFYWCLAWMMDFNANAATNALSAAINGTAVNPAVNVLSQSISNPPTQAQVQLIQAKINELINAITRPLA